MRMTDTINIFSHEPELAVLSINLKNPTLVNLSSGPRFYMFSSIPHQVIYKEMEDLYEKNLVADSSLVVASLESSGTLNKAGGKEYIEYLLGLDYPEANLSEYVRILQQSYKARMAITAVSTFKTSEITTDNVDTLMSTLKRSIDNITETSGGSATVHIGDNMKEFTDTVISRVSNPGIRGFSWGISDIDITTGGKSAGDLWIIASRPSMGKTAVICNSLLKDGENGVPSILFEKEMNYQSLVERLVAIDTGIPLQNIRMGILNQEQLKLILASGKKIKEYPIYIDTNFKSDVYYLESTISRHQKVNGIKNVYLDYLQLFAERDDNQTHELGRISRTLKLLSTELNICTIAVSQLNRMVEMRDNKRPFLSDLRQSGNLEEDADFVVGLYRDDYYNTESSAKGLLEFIVLKARNGPVGTLTLKFVADSNKVLKV
jgi:replicative DNA helicase